jgi:hypothetical protein
MPLVAVVLVAAIVVGYALGGRLRRVEGLRLRWWGLAPIGLLMQAIPLPTSSPGWRTVGVSLLIASFPVLIVLALANIRIAGMALILLGLVLNLTVIAANRGMPVTRHAILASGQSRFLDDVPRHRGTKHYLAKQGDILLEPLADVIAIGRPINDVVSVGDCAVYAGMFWLIVAAMRGRWILRGPKTSQVAASRA